MPAVQWAGIPFGRATWVCTPHARRSHTVQACCRRTDAHGLQPADNARLQGITDMADLAAQAAKAFGPPTVLRKMSAMFANSSALGEVLLLS